MGLLDIYLDLVNNYGGTALNLLNISDFVTQYPLTNTGTPTTTQNPGGPVQPFEQKYSSEVTYLELNPIQGAGSGKLDDSLPITNFDIENPGVQGGPANPINDPTVYSQYVSGVPTNTQNPGGPVLKFEQKYTSNNTYLNNNPIQGVESGKLDDSLDITNLDVENPSVQGGPLNDTVTVYPANNVTHTSPIRGWFAEPSQPPSNYNHSFTPINTYEDYIQNYI